MELFLLHQPKVKWPANKGLPSFPVSNKCRPALTHDSRPKTLKSPKLPAIPKILKQNPEKLNNPAETSRPTQNKEMPTTFIAVQCFQCSTMQVKQQKKSGNKWTCAVCNQKQSVRQVFAQGPMAKDLRRFVQSFNMSRKSADEQLQSINPAQSPSELNHHLGFDEHDDYKRKRRCDWTEYLDPEEGSIKEEDEGEDLGPKILTELPKEMFKRPKLKNYASQVSGQDGNLNKPVFRRRHTNKTVFMAQGKQAAKHQPAKVISGSKWSEYITRDDKLQTTTSLPTGAKNTSKWKDYINQEENDSELGNARNSVGDMDEGGSHNLWDSIFDDQKVEDDIHPDFI